MNINDIKHAITMASANADDVTANAVIDAVPETVSINRRVIGGIDGSVGDGMPLPYDENGNKKTTVARFNLFDVQTGVANIQYAIFVANETMALSDNQIRLVVSAELPFRYMSQRSPDGTLGFPLDYVNSTRSNMNHGTGDHASRKRPDGKFFRRFVDGVAVTDGHGNAVVTVPETDTKKLS